MWELLPAWGSSVCPCHPTTIITSSVPTIIITNVAPPFTLCSHHWHHSTSLVHTGTPLPWLPPALSLPPALPPPTPVSTTTSPPSMPPSIPVSTTTTCPTPRHHAVGSVHSIGTEPALEDQPEMRLSSSVSRAEAGLLQGQGTPAEVIIPPPPPLICP